jgi:hypothetical protein
VRADQVQREIGTVGRRHQGEGVGGAVVYAARLGGLERDQAQTLTGGQAEQAGGDDGLAHAGVGAGDQHAAEESLMVVGRPRPEPT